MWNQITPAQKINNEMKFHTFMCVYRVKCDIEQLECVFDVLVTSVMKSKHDSRRGDVLGA